MPQGVNLSCGNCKTIQSFSGNPPKCDVCGWVCENRRPIIDIAKEAKKTSAGESLRSLVWFAVIMALLFGAASIWEYVNEAGYIYHDTMTLVSSKGWTNGEYKNCNSTNTKNPADEPYLECAGFFGGDAKEFKVRFYGQTHVDGKADTPAFNWKCRKNGDTDPTITCEIQKQ